MKTYQSEQEFVTMFAKDCKESLRNGQNFEATVNNAVIVVSNMNNNNRSKVTMYSGTLDGVAFNGNITQLKKRLNIVYTKEYNRNSDAARTANTKVVIKSDEDLYKTAETATERYRKALSVVLDYSTRFFCAYPAEMDNIDTIVIGDNSVPTLDETRTKDIILAVLKQQRDEEQQRRENEAKRKAEEAAKKIASEKEKLEKQLAELQAKLAKMK